MNTNWNIKRNLLVVLAAVLLALASSTLRTETNDPSPIRLTLAQAIEEALQANPGLSAASHQANAVGSYSYLNDDQLIRPMSREVVATIRRGVLEPQSAYHADGRPAIAINIRRAPSGHALDTIRAVASALPALEKGYPKVAISIPDMQGKLIHLSVGNMLNALRDAIVMTVIVIFLFLADVRGMALAAISIPFTYLITFALMWLIGYEFDIVTLTAVILAVGMIPIALQWAIGLKRLSPLAVVAIGGRLVSTFLTMVYVPFFYWLFEDAELAIKRWFPRKVPALPATPETPTAW